MPTPILITKLFPPPLNPDLVKRQDLIDRLSDGLDRKVALISAPAGFGKSTLVGDWLEGLKGGEAAWLSLDEEDSDPSRFLTYLISTLARTQRLGADFGKGALGMLQSPQPPPIQSVLIPILNEIAEASGKIVLVLDDFHLIESQEVQDALSYFLEHLPPQLHLVISTRQDPQLPLGRLRAQGQITELRAADLRFSNSEAADFLNRLMGLDLSPEEIAALETKTEGWVAGLQLAAISLQGSEDIQGFIRSFQGSNRLVLDFLIEEVLGQLPEGIQEFLLQTSILNRLTGPLCDTLTGQGNSQETLVTLDRANLFILPLDEERRWYRYHHLFADLLRQRLSQTQPQKKLALHSIASQWYEDQGLINEAIEHALLSKDYQLATKLINEHIEERWRQGKLARIMRWLEKLPDEFTDNSPNLCVYLAWNSFTKGYQDQAERILQFIENHFNIESGLPSDEPRKISGSSTQSSENNVLGRVAAIRAVMATYRSDAVESKHYARLAQQLLPEDDLNWRSAAAMALADAYVFLGEYDQAHQARFESNKICQTAGNTYIYLIDRTKFILVLKARGELLQAQNHCRQLMEYAADNGFSEPGTIGWIQTILGDILAETNQLDEAYEIVREGVNLTELGRDVTLLSWSNMCLTRILISLGDFDGAEIIIKKTDELSQKATIPPIVKYQLMNYRVRIWLSQGRLDAAIKWMQEQTADHKSQKTYVDRMLNIPLTRIQIAQNLTEEANKRILTLLDAAESGGHISRVIELSILQALNLQAVDDKETAFGPLEKALSLAQPRGYFRIFVDEGPPMARLLYRALDREIEPEYVQRILAAFPAAESEDDLPQKDQSGLVEPLSEREIEVLEWMAAGLTNQEIAEQLIISPHTVKTHTRNIYAKLDVSNRTLAVGKARTLGILSPV